MTKTNKSQRRRVGGMPKHHRRWSEDRLRMDLSTNVPNPIAGAATASVVARAWARIDELERLYLQCRDPIHVYQAMLELRFVSQTLGRPAGFPAWIAAFVFRAFDEISGMVIAWPSGDRREPVKPPKRNSDGTITYFGDSSRGLTASQREKLFLEAFGVPSARGTNLLEMAHRKIAMRDLIQRIDNEVNKGLSHDEALEKLKDDPPLKNVGLPRLKIQRIRRQMRERS